MRDVNLAIFAVSHVYNCPTDEIRSKRRAGVIPRRVAAWVARQRTQASYPDIAKALGYGDHTSAMASVKWVEGQRSRSDDFRRRSNLALDAFGDWKRGVPFREAGGEKAANSRGIANLCPTNLIDANGFESPKHPEFRAGLYGGASYGQR